jgi:hypothetical protein
MNSNENGEANLRPGATHRAGGSDVTSICPAIGATLLLASSIAFGSTVHAEVVPPPQSDLAGTSPGRVQTLLEELANASGHAPRGGDQIAQGVWNNYQPWNNWQNFQNWQNY